jgi:hypothetical protein
MLNQFNLGHALPLRCRRFSCCARLCAIQRVCEMIRCISQFVASNVRCHRDVLSHKLNCRSASQIELLRQPLRSCCQQCFLNHEGHYDPI